MTIEAQIFPDDVGIGVEATTPETIANQSSRRPVEGLFLGRKFSAQRGNNCPDLEETGRDPGASYSFRQRAGGFGDVFGVVAGERLERGIEAIPVFETNRSDQMEWTSSFGVGWPDTQDRVGVGERQRLEAEGGGGGCDATVGPEGHS